MGNDKTKLTVKQEMFCRKFVECGCAAVAYREAYNTGNMKDESVQREAFTTLRHPKIAPRIKELTQQIFGKLELTAESTIRRLHQGQEFDIRRLYRADGSLKHPHELDDDTARAIVGLKYDAYGQPEYKIIDVKGCCELLGKHQKLFADQVNLQTDPSSPLGKLLLSIASSSKPIPDPVGDDE